MATRSRLSEETMTGKEHPQSPKAARRWWRRNARNVALIIGIGTYISMWTYDLADWLYRPLSDLPADLHADILHHAGLFVILGVLGWMRRNMIRPIQEAFARGYQVAREHAAASKDGSTVVRLPASVWNTPDEATGTDNHHPAAVTVRRRRHNRSI